VAGIKINRLLIVFDPVGSEIKTEYRYASPTNLVQPSPEVTRDRFNLSFLDENDEALPCDNGTTVCFGPTAIVYVEQSGPADDQVKPTYSQTTAGEDLAITWGATLMVKLTAAGKVNYTLTSAGADPSVTMGYFEVDAGANDEDFLDNATGEILKFAIVMSSGAKAEKPYDGRNTGAVISLPASSSRPSLSAYSNLSWTNPDAHATAVTVDFAVGQENAGTGKAWRSSADPIPIDGELGGTAAGNFTLAAYGTNGEITRVALNPAWLSRDDDELVVTDPMANVPTSLRQWGYLLDNGAIVDAVPLSGMYTQVVQVSAGNYIATTDQTAYTDYSALWVAGGWLKLGAGTPSNADDNIVPIGAGAGDLPVARIITNLQTYKVIYDRTAKEFKIGSSSGDPSIDVLDSLRAGKTNAWKPWAITYDNGAKTLTYKNDPLNPGSSWNFDKGVQVYKPVDIEVDGAALIAGNRDPKAIDVNNGETFVEFEDLCKPWTVTITMINTVGKQRGKTVTNPESQPVYLQVVEKALTANGITFQAILTDNVYEKGVNKSDLVRLEVMDGSAKLVEGVHFELESELPEAQDSGVYTAVVKGINTYSSTRSANYTVIHQTLRLALSNPGADYKFSKFYDGTTRIDTSDYEFNVKFIDDVTEKEAAEDFVRGESYTVTNLRYTNASAGNDKTVSATIALARRDEIARNYRLKSGAFSVNKQVIKKAVPADSMIALTTSGMTFQLPKTIVDDWKAKNLEVDWASNDSVTYSSSGAKFTLIYPEEWPVKWDSTRAQGEYEILVDITEGANTEPIKGLSLGTLSIKQLGVVDSVVYTPASRDTSYYSTRSVKISVLPKMTDGTKGTFSYQWYQSLESGDSAKLSGKTSNELTVNTSVTEATDFSYYVIIRFEVNKNVWTELKSEVFTVKALPPPASLANAVFTINGLYTYNGLPQVLTADDFSVTVGENTLTPDEDYRIKGGTAGIRNNVNAGEGIIVIEGINAYRDSAFGFFPIEKRNINVLTDFNAKYNATYNGETQPLLITEGALRGLGVPTVVYEPADSARLDAGTWTVSVSFAEGANFNALELTQLSQPYSIRRVIPDTSMFTFTAPGNVAFTGSPIAVAKPAPKGLGLKYSDNESNEVRYNGNSTAPTAMGSYVVTLYIKGDRNFASYEVPLGTLTIYDPTISVAEGNREIPAGSTAAEVAVAPVKVAAAGVTFGPNPASAGSPVSIYWNGSKPVTGKLAVFTEMGRKIEIVRVGGTKKIGTWNTAGAPVGTYLIKGVLKDKDGNKVRVNSVVSVGK